MTHRSRTEPVRTSLSTPVPAGTGDDRPEEPGPEEARRLDLRLLVPALVAWAVLVVLVVHDVRTQLVGSLGCLSAGGTLLWAARRAARRRAHRSRRWLRTSGVLALSLVATGLTLGASAGHRATEHAGAVPELARERAVVTLTGVVLTEPRVIDRGDERPDLVVLELRITHVVGRGESSDVGTPVVVFADRAWAQVPWRGTVTTRARLGAPDPGDAVVAVATPLDAPTVEGSTGPVLAGAEHVRDRLRRSVDPLPVDARALIPGLVIGDTSLTPADLSDAMLATGMSHLSAVSGAMFREGVLSREGCDLQVSLLPMDLGASADHERRLLDRVEAAAASVVRVEAEAVRAREVRDQAVRAAVNAGVPGAVVAEAAGVSAGLVARIRNAPRA